MHTYIHTYINTNNDFFNLGGQDFIFKCNLESNQNTNVCFVQESEDSFDWTLASGQTPSGKINAGNTGPSNDHSYQNATGKSPVLNTSRQM